MTSSKLEDFVRGGGYGINVYLRGVCLSGRG